MIPTPFTVGEVVILKEGYFQVTRFEPGHIRLKEIPADQAITLLRDQFVKLSKPVETHENPS